MKNNVFFFALSALILSACSSNDSGGNNTTEILVKTLVIDAVNPADIDSNLSFTYDGIKLLTVKDNNVVIQEYLYTGDKLTRINSFEDDIYILFEYTGGVLTRFTEFDTANDEAVKHLITYSGSNYTTTTYSGDLSTQDFLENTIVTTISNGNVIQEDETSNGNTSTTTFTHDTKNNPFKNISNFNVFQHLDSDLDGSNNNITIVNYSGYSNTVTYVYNAENYPTSEATFNDNGTLVETSTYSYY
ncbi:hypothetical protein [Flavobacterium sp.]